VFHNCWKELEFAAKKLKEVLLIRLGHCSFEKSRPDVIVMPRALKPLPSMVGPTFGASQTPTILTDGVVQTTTHNLGEHHPKYSFVFLPKTTKKVAARILISRLLGDGVVRTTALQKFHFRALMPIVSSHQLYSKLADKQQP